MLNEQNLTGIIKNGSHHPYVMSGNQEPDPYL
jgi:hypothetical protein